MNLTENVLNTSTGMYTAAYSSNLYGTSALKTTTRSPNDTSLLKQIEKELEGLDPLEVVKPLLICALVIVWCVFSLLYSSRVLGFVITQLLSKLYKGGYLKIGSFSVSVLGGKLMFRDIQYITEDASVKIRYAWAIFRWWGPYKAKDVSVNLSNEPIRLEFYVEGIEVHVYNRSSEYSRLEKIFGLEELMMPSHASGSGNNTSNRNNRREKRERLPAVTSESSVRSAARQAPKNSKTKKISINWRSLVPVIKVDIVDGQALFGNALLPQTLMIKFAEAKGTYSTKKASNQTDLFTHVVNGNVELLRVLLVPSTGYAGQQELPPRNMGEGFVVAHTHRAEVYFYMDEPGTVPYGPEVMEMANGECVVKQTFPEWGMEIKCSKTSPKKTALCMTNISYGPWADRHRAALYKFFFPADHQTHPIMDSPEPGERRVHRQFDFRLTFLVDTMIDILYTKDKEMHALHMQAGPGSSLSFVLPLYVENALGYVTSIRGQLLHSESTTSLSYRELLRAEMLDFDVKMHYPRFWNDHQDWQIKLTAHKASVFFLYEHVDFIFDMISDWNSPPEVPDIFSFVPYTLSLEVQLKDFEFIFLTNEHNWVNTSSSGSDENAHLAICGDLLSVPVVMPFHEFLPEVVTYKIDVSGECIDVRLFLPESNTSRHLLVNLAHNARIVDRNGVPLDQPFGTRSNKWRKVTDPREGWVDVMSTPMVGVNVRFANHPLHTLNDEAFDDLISSMHGSRRVDSPTVSTASQHMGRPLHSSSADFDRTLLPPDEVTVDVEVAQSVIMLYGSLLKYFLHLKENYLGENLKMADMCSDRAMSQEHPAVVTPYPPVLESHRTDETAEKKNARMPAKRSFDPRAYRSYAVKVSVILQDIQGHLVQHCTPTAPPCPTAYVQGLVFEMDKRYEETKLQVVVSPVTILSWDYYQRADGGGGDSHLQHGHLSLSGLQVRGHGMFSHCGLPLESDTVEYAWLMELTLGDIKGKITAPQLHSVVQFLRTAAFLVDDVENQLCRPSAERCQHQNPQPACSLSRQALEEHRKRAAAAGEAEPAAALIVADESYCCPTENDIKYRMTRCSVDLVDIYIAEAGVALNVQIYPVRFATCNLHGANNKAGLTALVQYVHLKQYVCASKQPMTASSDGNRGNSAATGPSAVDMPLPDSSGIGGLAASNMRLSTAATDRNLVWLEAGALMLGPINVDSAMSLPAPELRVLQHDFLQRHDRHRQNLWFLWPSLERHPPEAAAGGGADRSVGQQRTDGSAGEGASVGSSRHRLQIPVDRCACHGGCAFFGRNENGRSFFHAVQPSDFSGEVRSMLAVPRLTRPPNDPGFGQSILQPSAFVLDLPDLQLAGWSSNVSGLPGATSGSRVRDSERTGSRTLSQTDRKLPRYAIFADPATAADGAGVPGATAFEADSWDHPSPSSTLKPAPFMQQHASDFPRASPSPKQVANIGRSKTSATEVAGCDDGGSADDDDDESEAVTVVGRTDGSGRRSRSTSAGPPSPARRIIAGIDAGQSLPSPVLQRSAAETPTTVGLRTGAILHDGLMPGSLGSSDSFYSAESSLSASSSQLRPERRQRPRSRPPRWTRQASANSDGARARVMSPASEVAAAAGFSGSSTQSLYEMAQPYFSPVGIDEHADFVKLRDVKPEWYSSDEEPDNATPPRLTLDEDDNYESDDYYYEGGSYQFEYNVNGNADTWPADPGCGQAVPPPLHGHFILESDTADLQCQLKDKITNSALLMSRYMRHMSRLRSQSWSVLPQPPHLRLSARSPLADRPVTNTFGVSGLCSPRFTTIAKGFSPDAMTVRKSAHSHHKSKESSSSDDSLAGNSADTTSHQAKQEIYHDATDVYPKEEQTEGYSKTTAICRVVGSIDILVSPLSVEAIQRYVDALMPVFSQEHPAAIVDNLHFEISSNVQSQNKIKKMQAKLETQDRAPDSSAKPRDDSGPTNRVRFVDSKEGAKQLHASSKANAIVGPTQSRQRSSTLPVAFQGRGTEPQRDWRLQIMVTVAKVNVCILQASMTEDLSPMFSGERVRDLTSVSLLAVCLYDISFTSLLHSHSRRLCSATLASEVAAGRSENTVMHQSTGAAQTIETSLVIPVDSTAPRRSSATVAPAVSRQNSCSVVITTGSGSQPSATFVTASMPDKGGSRDDDVFEEACDAAAATAEAICTHSARPKVTAYGLTNATAAGTAATDADDNEGLEQNTEEIVGNLSVKQIHFQFRRLLDADLPDNVKLTAIPERRSRVIFTIQQHSSSSPNDEIGRQQPARQRATDNKTSSFIMFECGVDCLSANAARRRGFSANQQSLPLGLQSEEPVVHDRAAARGSVLAGTKYFVEQEKPKRSTTTSASEPSGSTAPDVARLMDGASGTWCTSAAVRNQQLEAGEKLPPAGSSVLCSAKATAGSDALAAAVDQSKQLAGDATAITVDTQTVWFSFAAPTLTQSHVDFTRFDWNLLSTASPAIDAWLSPINRLSTAVTSLLSQHKNRITGVMACIMTTALDTPGMHFIFKGDESRRALNTRLSRVVQEDPSCQLMSVLKRYIRTANLQAIEDAVHVSSMPPLITLQKGMLALTRQWRNQLYMPPVTKLGKSRRGEFTVHFDVLPEKGEQTDVQDNDITTGEEDNLPKDEDGESHGSESDDAGDDANEGTSLIQPPIGRSPSILSNQSKGKFAVVHSSNPLVASAGKHITTCGDSTHSDTLSQSCYENPANDVVDGPVESLYQLEPREKDDEDLYRWMARQQEYSRTAPLGRPAAAAGLGLRRNRSFLRSLVSEVSGDTLSQGLGAAKVVGGTSNANEVIARLADAQLMFRPLLEAVGLNIHGLKSSAIMRNTGGNLSIATKLQSFCIDIVEEGVDLYAASTIPARNILLHPAAGSHAEEQSKIRRQRPQCFVIPPSPIDEATAFSCKLLSISVSLRDMLHDSGKGSEAASPGSPLPTAHPTDCRRTTPTESGVNLKQQSAHAISVAIRNLETSRPTTKVYVSIDLVGVSQHVNMALLRLLHQVFTVIENMNWTRAQIRKQERLETNQLSQYRRTHRKQDSSSSADTQYASAAPTSGPVEQPASAVTNELDVAAVAAVAPQIPATRPTADGSICPPDTSQRESTMLRSDGPQMLPVAGRGTQATKGKSSPIPVARRPSKLQLNRHIRKFNLSVKNDPVACKSPTSLAGTAASTPVDTTDGWSLPAAGVLDVDAAERQPLLQGSPGQAVGNSLYVRGSPDSDPCDQPRLTQECWKKLSHLLDLYSKTPETKTVSRKHSVSRLSDIAEEAEGDLSSARPAQPSVFAAELGQAVPPAVVDAFRSQRERPLQPVDSTTAAPVQQQPLPAAAAADAAATGPSVDRITSSRSSRTLPEFTKGMFSPITSSGENVLLIAFGYLRVHDVSLRAALSGLKLEAEIRNIYGSLTHKTKEKRLAGPTGGCTQSSEMSVTLNMDKSLASLLEDSAVPQMQKVVSMNLSRSYCLYTSVTKRKRDYNAAVLSVGAISINIPQHASSLHEMVTRSSRRLHDTFQQLTRRSSQHGTHPASTPGLPGNSLFVASHVSAASASTAVSSSPSVHAGKMPSCDNGVVGAVVNERTATTSDTPFGQTSSTQSSAVYFDRTPVECTPPAAVSVGDAVAADSAATDPAGLDAEDTATGIRSQPVASLGPLSAAEIKRRPKKPFVVHFQVALKSLAVRASLLPSLTAQYQFGQVTWSGVSGSRPSFSVQITSHSLSFAAEDSGREAPLLPSSASVDLPPMRVDAEYRIVEKHRQVPDSLQHAAVNSNYLYAMAEVGVFEHSLTTNLLNHLIVVQKVFVKEINDVLQKVAGSELMSQAPSNSRLETGNALHPPRSGSVSSNPKLFYEIALKLKGIQVTATTPTSTAVRFETSAIEMEVSNRLHRPEDDSLCASSQRVKLFFKVHVDVNLSLGQLVKNVLFEEAEAEFHAVSFFATSIDLRNAHEDELSSADGKDQVGPRSREAVLISLRRPIFSVQPAAFDKAVMVWLSYRSAYEYWHEQRRNLAAEMQATLRGPATRARSFVFGGESGSSSSGGSASAGLPIGPRSVFPSRLSADDIVSSSLFLQLTITDLGICLPLVSQDSLSEPVMSSFPSQVMPTVRSVSVTSPTRRLNADNEPGNAVVLTIKETQINACSCGSLSSRGNFSGFCLRFAKDFEVSLDDWKPDSSEDPVMNACIVEKGTVEVCSQTVSSKSIPPAPVLGSLSNPLSTVGGIAEETPNAKWILHIGWEMEGMDVNLNTSISKHLSDLGHALTALTGDTDALPLPLAANPSLSAAAAGLSSPKTSQSVDEVDAPLSTLQVDSGTRSIVDVAELYYDTDADPETRMKTLENEIFRLANHIQELRQAGVKPSDIEIEEKKLGELESLLGSQFRRGFMDRIKRQSARASTFKDSLGLSFRHSSHHRLSNVGFTMGNSSRAKRIVALTPVAEHPGSLQPRSAYEDAPDDVDSSVQSPHQPVGSPTATISRAVGSEGQVMTGTRIPLSEEIYQPGLASSSRAATEVPGAPNNVPAEPTVVMRRKGRLPQLNLAQFSHDISSAGGTFSESPQPRLQSQVAASSSTSTGEAPTIDLVLELTVKIKSGHCVLHPNDVVVPQADTDKEAAKGSRNLKSALSHSPTGTRKVRGESVTSQNLAAGRSPKAPDNRTVFLLPGIEVKLHYESRTGGFGSPPSSLQRNLSPSVIHEPQPRFMQAPLQPGSGATQAATSASSRRTGPKRANIYAWIELQALSEEMVVTTKLLDFLEQALEQIDLEQLRPKSFHDKDGVDQGEDTDDDIAAESGSAGELSTSTGAGGPPATVVGSFPVDIIVYCSVQPSLIRFSCLPVSRIECLVQLPSLSLVFSTQRNGLDGGDSGTTASDCKKESRAQVSAGSNGGTSTTVAGLSVTACLTDFSVFVFHPYGGSTAMSGGTTNAATRMDATPLGMPWAESSTNDNRDDGGRNNRRIWLSLNMKLLKVHLGRTRRSTVEMAPTATSETSWAASSAAGDKLCNSVKFSMVVDMDSAEFKFDMRRLSDILDLPKAWYRSSLARRMFLGDETNLQQDLESMTPSQPHTSLDLGQQKKTRESSDESVLHRHRRTMSDGQYGRLSPLAPSSRWQQRSPGNDDALAFSTLGRQANVQKPSQPAVSGSKSAGSTLLRTERQRLKALSVAKQKQSDKLDVQPRLSWKTLVLGAVNLSKFELRVNMGNLMGSTVWKTDKLKCQGRLSVDSLGHKEVSASARLMQSDLEAKGGVTGGIIQLSSLNSFVAFRESCGELPSHRLGVGLATMETKLDYMGTSVLMLRLSDLDAQVFDDWSLMVSPGSGACSPPPVTARTSQLASGRFGTSGVSSSGLGVGTRKPSTSPVQIFVFGNVEFNQFQVMITRSTTPDLIKMAARVDEYFRQQMRSSKRMFDPSAFGLRADFTNNSRNIGGGLSEAESAENVTQTINHRRHWQSVLRHAAGSILVCQLPGCQPLPERGSLATIVGGSLRFQGKNLSLACYHGVNFRSKSWVLFILQEPSVSFAAEAQDTTSVTAKSKVDTRILQTFIFSLGQSTTRRLAPYSRVATICKVSRSQMPPTFNTVSEWFAYTFSNPELKDYAKFDSAGVDPVDSPAAEPATPRAKASASGNSAASPSLPLASKKSSYRYSHDLEIIFTLPSLVLQMKTDHRQLYRKPTESDPRPDVVVSFVTEFEGHISVAMDAELIMWLHEVVTAYVRERETQKDVDGKVMEPASGSKFTTDTTGELKKDWREFLCSQWQLEPTVRLLSWPGGRIEPVGVDYILTQLGFRHARSTIPKWIQRGMMDPCDALCAKLVKGLLIAMQKKLAVSDGDDCLPDSSDSPSAESESSSDDCGNDDGEGTTPS